jgi:uncharacterized repeat protein (TIGR01451 family)
MQKTRENERRDYVFVIILILLLGFLCIILASGWALRFAPSWKLNTSMGSNLDPNSDFLTNRPVGFINPLDPAILTNPAWINIFLTPDASLPKRTPVPTSTVTNIPPKTSTPISIPTLIPLQATNTLAVFIPPPAPTNTKVHHPPPPTVVPPPTATKAPPPSADLQITKTDNAMEYSAGISVKYTIVVSNAGPSNVSGAAVTDIFSTNTNVTSASWTCSATGSAACTASGAGDINDSVNLTAGSSVTYIVTAVISASPVGNLVNIASVSIAGAAPAGITDPVPGNNSAADTDTLIVPDAVPPEIGTNPDGTIYNLASNSYLTLSFNITVNGHVNADGTPWDLVYYERPAGSGVALDWMIVQIGDGQNWYTVFYWGDNNADTNANMNFNILPPPIITPPTIPPEEPDQRDIPSASLYTDPVSGMSTGIAINLDGVVPPGNYRFIRFFAPPGDVDGHSEIDAVQVLP